MADFFSGRLKFNIDEVGPLATAIESYQYARDHMDGKPRFPSREDLLSYAIDTATVDGLLLEFGVFSGQTINLIAEKRSQQPVYGFDSFEGLPEQWMPGASAGHFAVNSLPAVRENVELVVGWFDRVLPTFLDNHPGNVSLLHVDCDLYSSTQTVLTQLRTRIVPGTVIVFDEYFNYPDWKRHEYLAFQEYVKFNRIRYEYIGLVPSFEMVAVKIL